MGDFFIADFGNNVMQEVVKATGDIITVAGDGSSVNSGNNGPATAAGIERPRQRRHRFRGRRVCHRL